jgi:pimeloyl-ACP methyl ester carboxylesterase
MRKFPVFGLALALTACGSGSTRTQADALPANDAKAELAAAAETIVIGTRDGRKIYASHVPVPHARATIVLFHQAGSSSYEYTDIAPRLNEAGYSTLAVDQRSGGRLYGPNRTVIKAGKTSQTYLDALPDLEAALNWSRLQGQPVILWGSSYSAGLIFRIAADNPDRVAALLAFSPGEYFSDKHYVVDAARKVVAPVFITQAKAPDEIAAARAIFAAVPGTAKTLFMPKANGVHGSSTLRPDRNPAGAEENWRAVMTFLGQLRLRPS